MEVSMWNVSSGVSNSNSLNRKLTALAATCVLVVLALPASAANVTLSEGGRTGSLDPVGSSDTIVLDVSWSAEAGEAISAWSFSIECSSCIVTGFSQPYLFSNNIDWTGQYAVFSPQSFPLDPLGSNRIGTIGSANISGDVPTPFRTVIAYVTIHITSQGYGSQGIYPGFFGPAENITGSGGAVPTTFDGMYWTGMSPEPGSMTLLGAGLVGLGIWRRHK